MFNLLTGPLFRFPKHDVRVLCDELNEIGGLPVAQPTRRNILRDLKWLTDGIQPGESVMFFFAGHGDFVEDVSGDEIESGFDQVCYLYFLSCFVLSILLHKRMPKITDSGVLTFFPSFSILESVLCL